eukprot:scaffold1220_cov259-Pinguiococcus_pyrenoidosus.AAC.110
MVCQVEGQGRQFLLSITRQSSISRSPDAAWLSLAPRGLDLSRSPRCPPPSTSRGTGRTGARPTPRRRCPPTSTDCTRGGPAPSRRCCPDGRQLISLSHSQASPRPDDAGASSARRSWLRAPPGAPAGASAGRAGTSHLPCS